MPFVLDASVTLAAILRDETSDFADRILGQLGIDTGLVPTVWEVEVSNSLLIALRRGRFSIEALAGLQQDLLDLPISVREVPLPTALGSIFTLANEQNLTIYDTTYLDLAIREGVPLATLDKRLRSAAQAVGVPVHE